MTVLEFATSHPWWSLVFLLAGGYALGEVLAAPVTAWRKWTRPNDCPRCHGTGREP